MREFRVEEELRTVGQQDVGSVLSPDQTIGGMLQSFRKREKIGVKELARLTNLSTLALRKIENGTRMPTGKSVDLIITVLKLNAEEATRLKSLAGRGHFFGVRIKMERQRRGMSLRDVADNVGLSHGALQKIENGQIRPTLSTVLGITNALGLEGQDWDRTLHAFLNFPVNLSTIEAVILEIIRESGIDVTVNDSPVGYRFAINLAPRITALLGVAKG
jgi:transcriptional regulator with XRE-family HTH domain